MGASWAPIWASWAPKLAPSSVQDGSCDAFFVKKQILKKPRKTIGFSRFLLSNMAPKTLQDRPKTPPRRSWRGTFSMFKIVLDFDPFWVRFWVPLGAPLGSKRRPKIDQIRVPDQGRPQEEPQEAPRGSKRPQEGPKRPQEVPQKAPQSPKRALKRHQENPKRPQEAPGSPQGKVD